MHPVLEIVFLGHHALTHQAVTFVDVTSGFLRPQRIAALVCFNVKYLSLNCFQKNAEINITHEYLLLVVHDIAYHTPNAG